MKIVIYKNDKAYKIYFLEIRNYDYALTMAELWISQSSYFYKYTADIIVTSEKANNNVLTL